MNEFQPLALAAPALHLRRLVMIRWLIIICLCITLVLITSLSEAAPPYVALGIMLIFLCINWLTLLRLKHELPITEVEFFIQLLIDVLCLSALFYFSGGADNPFISYFLVPVCISAATLPWRYTWIITLICIGSYTLLVFHHVSFPLLSPLQEHAHQAEMSFHIFGMWLNFFISAVLITYFVVKMAEDLRRQDEQLNRRREDDLRNEQLMAVATLAAGTAHELGTPLSTIKVLLSELCVEHAQEPQLIKDLHLLSGQVEQCAQTLKQLVGKAEYGKDGVYPSQAVQTFCDSIIERWQIMRPEVTAIIHIAPDQPAAYSRFHPTIAQSIINLLNNAADANPKDIAINIHWNQQELHWQIEDHGPGIPMEIANQLGKPFVTTKGKGLGLGLFLTHASINRYGGEVRLYNRHPHGTLTELRLPLQSKTS